MNENKILIVIIFIIAVFGGLFFYTMNNNDTDKSSKSANENFLSNVFPGLDITKTNINIEDVVSGLGSRNPKDGIPALTNPKFVDLDTVDTDDDVQGILVEINGEKKFYPYNILTWHEIVNDKVGGREVVVTFCPLCGSAIVYDPIVDSEVKEFGVSGFLLESNMIMYDRTPTPTLWQQSTAKGIIGDQTDVELKRLPFQLLTFKNIRENHKDAKVLSTDTGFPRDYDRNPYSGYEDTEEISFGVSKTDDTFPGKEIFYIIPQDGKFLALRQTKLKNDVEYKHDFGVSAKRSSSGELDVLDSDGKQVAGYFEMWFSFAVQHPEDNEVWDVSKE